MQYETLPRDLRNHITSYIGFGPNGLSQQRFNGLADIYRDLSIKLLDYIEHNDLADMGIGMAIIRLKKNYPNLSISEKKEISSELLKRSWKILNFLEKHS